jgi:hypothetical protein
MVYDVLHSMNASSFSSPYHPVTNTLILVQLSNSVLYIQLSTMLPCEVQASASAVDKSQ